MKKQIIKNVFLILTILIPAVAFAVGSDHGDGHSAGISSLKFYIINFTIYAALIFYIAKKNLPSSWEARRKSLEASIHSSREKMDTLEKSYSEAKAKLLKVDDDIKNIRVNIAAETKREVEEIAQSAKLAVQRIEKQIVDTLGAEQRSFENEMRRIYTESALKLAEEKIKSQINAESDKSLRDSTINNIKRLMN